MNQTTRRTFFITLGSLLPIAGLAQWLRIRFARNLPPGSSGIPASWKAGGPSVPPEPAEPFPYLELFEPYPTDQPIFEKDLAEPSFLHPNRNWVVLPKASGGFEVWNWREGIPVQEMAGLHPSEHLKYPCGEDDLSPGCFAADGNTWITARTWRGGDDGQAMMGTGLDGSGTWDQSVSMTVRVDPRNALIHAVGWLGDGSLEGVFEINAESGELKRLGDLPAPIQIGGYSRTSCLSADGRWLLAWHRTGNVGFSGGWGWWAIWSLPEGKCRAFIHRFQWPSAELPGFSLDGAVAFGGGESWNWSGQKSDSDRVTDPWSEGGFGPSSVKVEGGSTHLIRKGEGILEVRSSRDQHLIRRLVAFPPNNALIAFGPKPHVILAAPPSGMPWIWNRSAPVRPMPAQIEDGTLKRPGFSRMEYGAVRSLAWSRDGKQVAVGTDASSVGLYACAELRTPDGTEGDDASLGKPIRILTGLDASVRGLAFLPEGIAALSQEGTMAIWGSGDEKPLRTWKVHSCRSNSLQVAPDFRTLATGSLDGVALWSMADGTLIRRLGSAHSGVACLHFDPKGERLAATYLDGWMALFDVRSGKVLWEVQAHSDVAAAVAFHPSGTWLVSLGWDTQMRKWEAKTGSSGLIYQAPKASGCLAWSRDGKWLAVGGSHPEVRDESLERVIAGLDFLWDAECT